MSEAKHTPGPWEWDQTRPYSSTLDAYGGLIGKDSQEVLEAGDCCISGKHADMHLIAAAPDLLAACEALVKRSRACFEACSYDVLEQAEAAIAKAKMGREA